MQKAGYKYMKVLGITGQVGAGKSTILAYLEEKYRAKVIQADQVGHLVMEPDTSCYKQICSLFGEQILAADQKIDRKKLGAIVFADQEKLAMLNAIVHPAVKEYIRTAVYLEKQRHVCRLWSWRQLFCWKNITTRSVMRSGIFMWTMRHVAYV